MAADTDNMSTEDASRRIAIKKAREENKIQQHEKRLEYARMQDMVRRRGLRQVKAGFGIIAFALCATAYTYYTNPSLIQGEMRDFKNTITGGPTSGPKS